MKIAIDKYYIIIYNIIKVLAQRQYRLTIK